MANISSYRPPSGISLEEQRRRHYAEQMEQSYAKQIADAQQKAQGMAGRYRKIYAQPLTDEQKAAQEAQRAETERALPSVAQEKAQSIMNKMREMIKRRQSEMAENRAASALAITFTGASIQVDQLEIERFFARGANGDYSKSLYFDRNAIPKQNFLDDAVKQYEERYTALSSMQYSSEQQKSMAFSYLNQDFAAYTEMSFKSAGLSKEDSQIAAQAFSREFSMSVTSGRGFEQSQLSALRKLSEMSPSLIKQVQYSGYSFSIEA